LIGVRSPVPTTHPEKRASTIPVAARIFLPLLPVARALSAPFTAADIGCG
jgi:hypothetical protein